MNRLEAVMEIRQVIEAALEGYRAYRTVRARQQFRGVFQAKPQDVLPPALPRNLPE
jgi:hypothetical protein